MAHVAPGSPDLVPALPFREVERLVFAPEHNSFDRYLQGRGALVTSDSDSFSAALLASRPALIVLFRPPAETADVAAALTARRRRRELRVVLINRPDAVADRLAALRDGFDEALGWDVDGRELAGRLLLLVEEAHAGESEGQIPISPEVMLDPGARELRIHGEGVHLRPRESALLEILAREPGRTFTREQLLEAVASGTTHRGMRTIDVHIRWLRAKLERDPRSAARLVTVRGVGYRLERARRTRS